MTPSNDLVAISEELSDALDGLTFAPPVAHVYNPLVYAAAPHRAYLERYGSHQPETLLVGMNPGPWGMAQTGVPFGAVRPVADWLGLGDEPVAKPPVEHPKRPVTGFACGRNEVSGERIWGWAREVFGTPERFFERFFVGNYCPLLFLEAGARNLTPDKLAAADRKAMLPACDQALRRTTLALGVRRVLGVGVWAEQRARVALEGLEVEIGRILHPSPASPAANRGWAEQANQQLRALGIDLPG